MVPPALIYFGGRGLETGYPPELWSVERPDDIEWLRNTVIDVGSDLILTNSFSGTNFRLKARDAKHRVAELNDQSAKLVRQAAYPHTKNTRRKFL